VVYFDCFPCSFYHFFSGLPSRQRGFAPFSDRLPPLVGVLMAIFCAYLIEPLLPAGDLFKGLAYGVAVWLLNAFVDLLATGEGIAGVVHLRPVGMIWYAAAHTLCDPCVAPRCS
jgi:hypothetical protein